MLNLTLCLALACPPSGNVLVVDAGGQGAYTDIPAALLAAQSGDVLLVRPGTYSGFDMNGIGVSIVADPSFASQPVVLGAARVRNLPADQNALLDGLDLQQIPPTPAGNTSAGCFLADNLGSVRIQGCSIVGESASNFSSYEGLSAVIVEDCEDVAILDSQLTGGSGLSSLGYAGGAPQPSGGDALVMSGSNVALQRSLVFGGEGGDLPNGGLGGVGGTGVWVVSGTLYSGHNLIAGGDSGDSGDGIFWGFCAPGGTGLFVGGNAQASELGSILEGGAAGAYITAPCSGGPQPGLPSVGPLVHLNGTPRALVTPTVAREGQGVTTEYFGAAGDLVWRIVGSEPSWRWKPGGLGVLLVNPRAFGAYQFQGTLGPGGQLAVPESWPALGDVDVTSLHMQGLFLGAGSGPILSNPVVVTVLDPAF